MSKSKEKGNKLVQLKLGGFWKNKMIMFSVILLLIIILFVFLGPLFCKYDYYTICDGKNLPISKAHIFGTDSLGRDLFVRVCYGSRISILIGISCAVICTIIGVLYGGISVRFGGIVDVIMMRITDILSCIPNILIIILISIYLDSYGIISIMCAMCIVGWCDIAKVVRGKMLKISNESYIKVARRQNVSEIKILVTHYLPNAIDVIFTSLTIKIPNVILVEAFLSYIGLGVQSPNTSLGSLISNASKYIIYYPQQMLFPLVFLVSITVSFSMFCTGVKQYLSK